MVLLTRLLTDVLLSFMFLLVKMRQRVAE